MCGIVGAATVDGSVDFDAVIRSRDSVTHRGPDDAGEYRSADGRVALGFRRLSIIDLSAAGHQPMSNEDSSVQLVFNGEIYNYAELRRELEERGHRFSSHTDSETIVHLYEDEGEAAIDRLTGMFALAVWDEPRGRLLLARDRLGIKPLYYAWDGRRLCFGSELRALLELGQVERRVDGEALADYLTYGYVPYDRALIAGVRKLPPGHLLTADLNARTVEVRSYWDVEYTGQIADRDEATEGLSELLDTVVAEHLVADVPLGLFLSGGVDSTAVLTKMRKAASTVEAFGIGFDTGHGGELPQARETAAFLGASFHERVVGVGHASQFLDRLAELYDEPLVDYSTIPTYEVSRFAREQVTVALSGDGGDEVFGGYNRYLKHVAAASERGRPTRAAAAAALHVGLPVLRQLPFGARAAVLERSLYQRPEEGYHRRIGLFDGWEQRRLLGPAAGGQNGRDPLWLLRRFFRPEYPLAAALRYLDLKTYLPDNILVKVDRASMAVSLEVRPPLLDHRVVEFAFGIDDRLVVENGVGKAILRGSIASAVPRAMLERPKRGFSARCGPGFRTSWPRTRWRNWTPGRPSRQG